MTRVYPSTMVVVLFRAMLAVVAAWTAFFQERPAMAVSTSVLTNWVVAIWVVLVPAGAVGAVGVPESAGEARFALSVERVLSWVWILLVTPLRKSSSVLEMVGETMTFPEASETRAEFAVRLAVVMVEAHPVMADCARALVK